LARSCYSPAGLPEGSGARTQAARAPAKNRFSCRRLGVLQVSRQVHLPSLLSYHPDHRAHDRWSNPLPLPETGPDSRRATIRDVAARAGVSIGTASKALNGQGKLRAETRDRVAAAARELGFAPNVLARGLLAGRTYTVGVITTDSFGRFSIPVML